MVSLNVNWLTLPVELWSLIAAKLDSSVDCIRFRAVCSSLKPLLPSPNPIWLMLPPPPPKDDDDNLNEHQNPPPPRGFLVVAEQRIHQLNLPEAHNKRCVGSTGAWMVTLDSDNKIRFLNPFSRVELNLLPQFKSNYLCATYFRSKYLIRKIILSSSDFSSTDCVVMAIRSSYTLAFAKPGDAQWTDIDNAMSLFEDVIFYGNRFYAVDGLGYVMVGEVGDDTPKYQTYWLGLQRPVPYNYPDHSWRFYLVEWRGWLSLVLRHVYFPPRRDAEEPQVGKTVVFKVYKTDFENRRWVEFRDLGEYSLFLGASTSVSVKVSDYTGTIKRNCIYFTGEYTDDINGGFDFMTVGCHDMGVYDMEEQRFLPCYGESIPSHCAPSIWVVPPPSSSA